MKAFVKALKVIGNVILWLFVAFSILVTVLVFSAQSNKDGLANIGGKAMINIVTNSMKPTFKTGDLIFSKVLTNDEKSTCEIGDVITYYVDLNDDGNDELNTHRIVDKYKEDGYTFYVTKGDNKETNPVNDKSPVNYTKVVAKYSGKRLAAAGNVIKFLQTSTGFLCVIVIPLVIFFLFELYNFVVIITKAKMKGKVSAVDEEEIKRRAIEEYLSKKNESENQPVVTDNKQV